MRKTCLYKNKDVNRLFFWLILLAGVGSVIGCGAMQSMLGGSDKPTIGVVDAHVDKLDLRSATLVFDVEVTNPYTVSIPLVGINYALSSENKMLLEGQVPCSRPVPARGSDTLTLPVQVTFSDLLQTLQDIRPGRYVPYSANLTVIVDAPSLGRINLPVRRQGQIPIPAIPRIELSEIHWQRLSIEQASATLQLKVANPNDFSIDLKSLDCSLALNKTQIVKVYSVQAKKLDAHQAAELQVPFTFAPKNLGIAVFRMLSGQGSAYDLVGTLATSTPFGRLQMPFKQSGQASFAH